MKVQHKKSAKESKLISNLQKLVKDCSDGFFTGENTKSMTNLKTNRTMGTAPYSTTMMQTANSTINISAIMGAGQYNTRMQQ